VVAVFLLKLDADVVPPEESGDNKAAARSRKWGQRDIVGLGEISFDDRLDRVDRLLGRMVVVARIAMAARRRADWRVSGQSFCISRPHTLG
jgi:hypothetical protein